MKTKVEIFSSQKLKNFFINLENFFDLSLKSYDELDSCSNSRNLSIVFIDQQYFLDEKTLNNILMNENFILIYKETSLNEKPSLGLKKNMLAPLSISRFLDNIIEFISVILYLNSLRKYNEIAKIIHKVIPINVCIKNPRLADGLVLFTTLN